MQANAPAPDNGQAPNRAETVNQSEDHIGFPPERNTQSPEGMPENGVENEWPSFMPETPEAFQGMEQGIPPEMGQAPNTGRSGM